LGYNFVGDRRTPSGERTTATWFKQVAIVAVLMFGMLYSGLTKVYTEPITDFTKLTENNVLPTFYDSAF